MTDAPKPQNARVRSTEGQRTGTPTSGVQRQRGVTRPDIVEGVEPLAPRPRGRPKGSKNQPKSILPTELANTMLLAMKEALPPDHYEYMRGVIKDGKAISSKRELDTLILLLSRNLYPALVMESLSPQLDDDDEDDEDFFNDGPSAKKPAKKKEQKLKMPVFRKDVTERLKVLQSLLAMKEKFERADASSADEKPILRIVAGSGIDASRLRVLVGVESSTVVGDTDEAPRDAVQVGTVSDSVPERPELLPSGEQD